MGILYGHITIYGYIVWCTLSTLESRRVSSIRIETFIETFPLPCSPVHSVHSIHKLSLLEWDLTHMHGGGFMLCTHPMCALWAVITAGVGPSSTSSHYWTGLLDKTTGRDYWMGLLDGTTGRDGFYYGF